jgi:hypothetical protein
MQQNPRIRRLGLIPISQQGEGVRRYTLARLEEVSLATPPVPDRLAEVHPLPVRDSARSAAS